MVAVLDRMRGLGVSERTIQLERDARILIQALDPHAMPQWIQEKNARFDELDAWQIEHEGDLSQPGLPLVDSLIAEASPAWQRVLDVLAARVQRRRNVVVRGLGHG